MGTKPSNFYYRFIGLVLIEMSKCVNFNRGGLGQWGMLIWTVLHKSKDLDSSNTCLPEYFSRSESHAISQKYHSDAPVVLYQASYPVTPVV
jgi:hypothetical protein